MKTVIVFIFCAYAIFFISLPPLQTPDELSHYELTYWTTIDNYPYINKNLEVNNLNFGRELSELFNLGNEDPMLILNYDQIKQSKLKDQKQYESELNSQLNSVSSQAYNPPLYYLTAHQFLVLARRLNLNVIQQFYVVRFTSGLFYFGTIFLLWKILKVIFGEKKLVMGILIGLSLNPLLLQSAVGISPDIASLFMAMLFCYFVLKLNNELKVTSLNMVNLGLIEGLGVLTKISNITLIPAFLVYFLIKTKISKKSLAQILIFIAVFVFTQVPWSLLNFLRYGKLIPEQVVLGALEDSNYKLSWIMAILKTLLNFRHTVMHYAGFLGQNDAYPFSFVFIAYVLAVVCLFGLGVFLAKKPKILPHLFLLFSLLSSFIFFFGLAVLRMVQFHPGWGIGGRNVLYMYPIAGLYTFIGLTYILRGNSILAAKIWGFLSIFYYFYILVFVLWPRYYV